MPINYLNEEGNWSAIDTDFAAPTEASSSSQAPAADYAGETAEAFHTASIPEDAERTAARLAVEASGLPGGEAWVTMKLDGLEGSPSISGDTATFSEFGNEFAAGYSGADSVELQSTVDGLKETIILDEPPEAPGGTTSSASPYGFDYEILASDGLTPFEREDGSIIFSANGASGDAVFTLPLGNMFDSAQTPDAAYSNSVEYELARNRDLGAEGWHLRFEPSLDWLTDPARVYPVMIDPSITNGSTRDCALYQDQPSTNRCGDATQFLRVGHTSGGDNRRAVLKFATDGLPSNAVVDHSNLELWLDPAETTTGAKAPFVVRRSGKAFNTGASWNSSGNNGSWVGGDPAGPNVGQLDLTGTAASPGWRFFDVTPITEAWADGTSPNDGFVVKQQSENTVNQLGFLSSSANNPASRRPQLTVRYNVPGGGGQGSAPTEGAGRLERESGYSSQQIATIDQAAGITEIIATAPLPYDPDESDEVTVGLTFSAADSIPADLSGEFSSVVEEMFRESGEPASALARSSTDEEVPSEPSPFTNAQLAQSLSQAEIHTLDVEAVDDVPTAYEGDVQDPAETDPPDEEPELTGSCGGPFYPDAVVQAAGTSSVAAHRFGTLNFSWSPSRMANLRCHPAVAFEPDYKSYNYDDNSYFAKVIRAWSSTLPNKYKDTQFSDGDDERIYTIGTSRAVRLHANRSYRTYFRTHFGSHGPGKVKFLFQRSKRIPSACDSTWCIFAQASSSSYPRDRWAPAPGRFRYHP